MFLFISLLFFYFSVFFSKFHYDLFINLDCYNSKLIIIRINVLIFIFVNFFFLICLFWLFWAFVTMCKLSLVATSGGYSLVEVLGLLTVVASFVAEHGL